MTHYNTRTQASWAIKCLPITGVIVTTELPYYWHYTDSTVGVNDMSDNDSHQNYRFILMAPI